MPLDRCDECGEDRETTMAVINGEPRDLCEDCRDYLRDTHPDPRPPCWRLAGRFCARRANGRARCETGTCYLTQSQGVLL